MNNILLPIGKKNVIAFSAFCCLYVGEEFWCRGKSSVGGGVSDFPIWCDEFEVFEGIDCSADGGF